MRIDDWAERRRAAVYSRLLEYRAMSDASARLADRVQVIESRLESLGSPLAPGGSGGSGDKMSRGIAELLDARAVLAEHEAATRGEFERARLACDDGSWALAVWMHVVDRMPWREAAHALGYSESYTRMMARESGIERIHALIEDGKI